MTENRLRADRRRLTMPLCVAAALVWTTLAAMAQGAPAPAPGAGYEALKTDYERMSKGGDLTKALAAAEKMNDVAEPLHVEALYDVARTHALMGSNEAAYEWFQRALDAGFWDPDQVKQDPAFTAMRQEDRFRAMMRAAWAKGYIAMLERPERESFQKREKVMEALAFRPGERVADVGAGSGYFTIPVAKAVAPSGVVWAVDISQEMLDYLAKRVEAEKLQDVKLKKVAKDDPQLPPKGLDTILMVDTLHYIQDRPAYAKKLAAGLAPGGRLVIIDYTPKPWADRPWGPPPEQQMARETVDRDMAAGGFKVAKAYEFLPEQYFVVYALQADSRAGRE